VNKLLSFDVSSVSTGYSLFEDSELKDCGAIRLSGTLGRQDKLYVFQTNVQVLLRLYEPNEVVIEETYLKNVRTLKTLTRFVTAVEMVCYDSHITPVFLNTMTVRSHFGLKKKEEVFDYVKDKYKVKLKKYDFDSGNDITDSILQALYWIDKEKENA
jgi:Holliday junction resolvasome RuvABC endonuclease subunit